MALISSEQKTAFLSHGAEGRSVTVTASAGRLLVTILQTQQLNNYSTTAQQLNECYRVAYLY